MLERLPPTAVQPVRLVTSTGWGHKAPPLGPGPWPPGPQLWVYRTCGMRGWGHPVQTFRVTKGRSQSPRAPLHPLSLHSTSHRPCFAPFSPFLCLCISKEMGAQVAQCLEKQIRFDIAFIRLHIYRLLNILFSPVILGDLVGPFHLSFLFSLHGLKVGRLLP